MLRELPNISQFIESAMLNFTTFYDEAYLHESVDLYLLIWLFARLWNLKATNLIEIDSL